MKLTQTQLQTCSKPTAAELIKEIAETYVNERGWADVMEVISCFIRENAFILGTRLEQEIIKEVQKQALQYKHCPFCGEELKRVAVEGYINYRCLKCMEDWRDNEVGKQNGS